MITTGFTYRGIHSSYYSIICDPSSRQLIPEKRRNDITIPGRSGTYAQEDGAYNNRVETFKCYFTRGDNSDDISLKSREIAAWLAADGVLCFDNEPDKFYDARCTGSPPMSKHLKYGEFDLTFTYSPPFAYTAQQSLTMSITAQTDVFPVPVAGTAPTPVRIIIFNAGSTTIKNLTITQEI